MIDTGVFLSCSHHLKEAMNLSFGGMKGVSKTILTGVDREAAQIARTKPLIRGGHDEAPVAKLKDTMSSWASAHAARAPSKASVEATGAMPRRVA